MRFQADAMLIGCLALSLLASAAGRAAALDPYQTQATVKPSVAGEVSSWRHGDACVFDGADGAPLMLADIVERALCNNPRTRTAWLNARYQAAQLGVARSAYFPDVKATAGISLNRLDGDTVTQESVGVSLSYVLYDFGARDAGLENARQILAAANASHDATLQSVFLAAVQAYYQLTAAQAAVEAAQQSEKASLESLNAAASRYKVGLGTPADKLQAQTAHSQAVLTRVRAEGELRTASGVLANVIGLDANLPVAVAPPLAREPAPGFEADVARLIDTARRLRPDLVAAEAQIKAAQAGVDVAKAANKPVVSLTTSLTATDTSRADLARNAAVGVQIAIPVFNGHSTAYKIRVAEEQLKIRQAERDALNLQVALDVWRAYQGLLTETQAVRNGQDLVASATESEAVALGRYKAGVGNILDVLSAQSALASARQQYIQASYNWQIARLALAQAMGQLDMSMVLPLADAAPSTTGTDVNP